MKTFLASVLLVGCAAFAGDAGLSKEQISEVIGKQKGPVAACYEKELQKTPGLEAKVNLSLVIDVNGKVEDFDVTGHAELARCIVNLATEWKFPKPNGGKSFRFTWPFVFSPPKDSVPAKTGTLSKEQIQQVIRKNTNPVRYCYEKALVKSPGLEGKVTISITIGGTGKVTSADVSDSTLSDASVSTCIAQQARTWVFPAPEGGGEVKVSYPFIFRAQN